MRKFTLLIASLFITIGAMAQTEISAIGDLSNQKVYKLESSRGFMIYNPDNSTVLASTSYYSSFDTTTDNAKWAIYHSETTGKYYFFNIGAQKFLGNNSNEAGRFPWVIVPTNDVKVVSSTKSGYPFVFSTDNYGAVNHFHPTNNKTVPGIANWKGNTSSGGLRSLNDDGSAHKVIEVENIDTEILARIKKCVDFYENPEIGVELSYTVTDNAGNTYEGTYVGLQGISIPAFTGAEGYTLTNEAWDGTNYTATINFAYPVSNKDNGVTNETMFNVKNYNAKLLRVVDEAVKVTNEAADANCLWAIYPAFNNGAFTFTIMNVATGKYIYSEASGSKLDTSGNSYTGADGVFALSETASVFTYEFNGSFYGFKFADGRSATFISINSPYGDTNVDLGIHTSAHGGTDFVAQSVPAYPVAITEAKYATFYAPVAVTVPDGVTAHTVTINGQWATLSEPLTIIPAYTGVVLYSETATTYTFAVTTSEPFAGENALRGTVAATYVDGPAYVLGIPQGETEACFANAVLTDGKFINNHHKAYLPKPADAPEGIASYSFRFGEGTTGVEKVEIRKEKSEIYDLTGRKVEEITAPGIYVVNGKKVLVK